MNNREFHKITHLNITDLLVSATTFGGNEFVPLSPTRRKYIDAEALMLKHDKRVARAFEAWVHENLY